MSDYRHLIDRVREQLVESGEEPDASRLASLIRTATSGLVSHRDLLRMLTETEAEVLGAGPLEVLLAQHDVTDVLVNGPGDVWVDRGAGLLPAGIDLGSTDDVFRLAQRLAARAGRRLDAASPWVDATLPNGARLHAVIPPIAGDCSLISVRTRRRRNVTLDEFRAAGLPADIADLLVAIVESRLSFLISGGTGTGKTTLLAMLLEHVAATDRVLLVEDADELRPQHPHTVKLLSRPPNIEGRGEVTLRSLVRQALRMRPDRIVLGEVRGAEIIELLMALNTGHRGGAGTIHANSVSDVPARVAALGSVADLSLEAIDAQLGTAIDVLIHVGRDPVGVRRVEQLAILDVEHRRPTVVPVWSTASGFTRDAGRLTTMVRR